MNMKKTNGTNARSVQEADTVLGERVRARRNEMKISQQTLGKKLGVSFQQVQKYEKGVNRIGASRLQQICAALDCGVTDLLGSSKKVAKITLSSTFAASRDGVAIILAMAKIRDPDLRRRVIRLTESLAG
jgi:transcriptional regulator with XRE-family HTH domain